MQREEHFLIKKEEFKPAYLETYKSGLLKEKVEEALQILENCDVCPRNCHVDRSADKRGICMTGRYARVSSYFPHFGEEDCLRGYNGSGTIFFSYCNLKCVFCQNYDISWGGEGKISKPEEVAEMILSLQERGCHNINFVTPEHVVPQLLEALLIAVKNGLHLPIVYNTSAYDSMHSLKLLDGIVDIYMPDFKFWTPEIAFKYTTARNYPETARKAIKEMHSQVGPLKFDEKGIALRGVLVRHLVMPYLLNETKEIMNFLANQISKDTYVNIMDQYRPEGKVIQTENYPEINRHVTSAEYRQAVEIAKKAGLYRFDERWPRKGELNLVNMLLR